MTFLLSKTVNLQFEQCFGMADTLVVPAMMAWSNIATTFEILPREGRNVNREIGEKVDWMLGGVLVGVGCFAVYKVITSRSRPAS
jgi:hypothetical protein